MKFSCQNMFPATMAHFQRVIVVVACKVTYYSLWYLIDDSFCFPEIWFSHHDHIERSVSFSKMILEYMKPTMTFFRSIEVETRFLFTDIMKARLRNSALAELQFRFSKLQPLLRGRQQIPKWSSVVISSNFLITSFKEHYVLRHLWISQQHSLFN